MVSRGVGHYAPLVMMVILLTNAPFTKVEESFNVQAMHDFIFGGGIVSVVAGTTHTDATASSGLATFDHHAFPGVVPRTCLGALAVASVAAIPVRIISLLSDPALIAFLEPLVSTFVMPQLRQKASRAPLLVSPSVSFALSDAGFALFLCRLVLGCLVCLSLWYLADGLDHFVATKGWKRPASAALVEEEEEEKNSRDMKRNNSSRGGDLFSAGGCLCFLVASTQFHSMYYATRPLPNTFAAIGCNLAFGAMLRNRPRLCIFLLAFTTCVFRADMAALSLPVCLALLFLTDVGFIGGVLCGLASMLFSVAVAVPLDTVFWNDPAQTALSRFRPLWPEFAVLYFNTAENRSSEWGVSAAHWYFTSALPRGLAGGAVFLVMALAARFLWSKQPKTTKFEKNTAFEAAAAEAVQKATCNDDDAANSDKIRKKADPSAAAAAQSKAAAVVRAEEQKPRQEKSQRQQQPQKQPKKEQQEKKATVNLWDPALYEKKPSAESSPPTQQQSGDGDKLKAEVGEAAAVSVFVDASASHSEAKPVVSAEAAPAASAPENSGSAKTKKKPEILPEEIAALRGEKMKQRQEKKEAEERQQQKPNDESASAPAAPAAEWSSGSKKGAKPETAAQQIESAIPRQRQQQQQLDERKPLVPSNVLYAQLSKTLFLLTTVPCLAFITLYSALPHKEIRFIMPCFPAMVCPAALWLSQLFSFAAAMRNGGPPSRFTQLVLLTGIVGSLALSLLSSAANKATYPGGHAMEAVNKIIESEIFRQQKKGEAVATKTTVFIDAFAGMSGVTRFGKLRSSPVAQFRFLQPLNAISEHTLLAQQQQRRQQLSPSQHQVIYVKNEQIFNLSSPAIRDAMTYSEDIAFDHMIVRAADSQWHVDRSCGHRTAKCKCSIVQSFSHFTNLNLLPFLKSRGKEPLLVSHPFLNLLSTTCAD